MSPERRLLEGLNIPELRLLRKRMHDDPHQVQQIDEVIGAKEEREKIVRWLRDQETIEPSTAASGPRETYNSALVESADSIDRWEHLK